MTTGRINQGTRINARRGRGSNAEAERDRPSLCLIPTVGPPRRRTDAPWGGRERGVAGGHRASTTDRGLSGHTTRTRTRAGASPQHTPARSTTCRRGLDDDTTRARRGRWARARARAWSRVCGGVI